MVKSAFDDYSDIMKSYDPTKNKSRNVLWRYEKTKIIGMRLEQLARGAPPYVEIESGKNINLREIVMLELDKRKLPFMIARTMPNGVKEYWRLDDMIIPWL